MRSFLQDQKRALDPPSDHRFWIFGLFLLLCLGVVISRMLYLGVRRKAPPVSVGVDQVSVRGNFRDRHGNMLTSTLKTFSIYVNPKLVLNPEETIRELKTLFPFLKIQKLRAALASDKNFRWILRHISPKERARVLSAGLPGVYLMPDQKRIYPHDRLFAHVLGFTDINNQGIEGLEKQFEKRLHSARDVTLSLDLKIQHLLHQDLLNGIQTYQAEGGGALLADLETGEILGMVSLPDFNPNQFQYMKDRAPFFNKNVAGVYEFGSLLKAHNMALVLENRLVNQRSTFDTSKPIHLGRFRISDFRGQNRVLDLTETFLYSSNIANVKMALLAGVKRQQDFFQKLGMLSPLRVNGLKTSAPIVPANWGEPTLMTLSYGYGLSFTPLHMLQSLGRLLTGKRLRLTLVKRQENVTFKPLLSQRTTQLLGRLMRLNTEKGTARKAAVLGYVVGAKTGTANRLSPRGTYKEKENFTCCAVVFPSHKPRYLLLTFLEHPKPLPSTHGFATAGWNAAPVASSMVSHAAPLLHMLPEAPRKSGR